MLPFFIKLSECIFLSLKSGKLLFNNYLKYNVYKLSLGKHFKFELLILLVQYVDSNNKILIKKIHVINLAPNYCIFSNTDFTQPKKFRDLYFNENNKFLLHNNQE